MQRSNEWGESLQATIERSRQQNSLLAYSMCADEVITVGISGHIAEGVEAGESRIFKARSLGLPTGALEVVEDSGLETNWSGQVVCLGSFAYEMIGIQFDSPGLLRGYIGSKNGVAVDLSGEHFRGSSPTEFLLAQYITLELEKHTIF